MNAIEHPSLITSVPIQNEAHWQELRAQHVGASEVAALFGLSPYLTRFTLWHRKAGNVATPEPDGERLKWGNRLEAAIAQGIAEDQGWTIRKVRRYLTHPSVAKMGASLDYEVFNHPDGPGCFEIKNVDRLIFLNQFEAPEGGELQAPIHIELQLQHQLSVTGRAWGAIGLLVGGNEAHVIIRKRHEPTIARIEAAVRDFWESIERGEAPNLEDASDLPTLAELFSGSGAVELESEEFEAACEEYQRAKLGEKAAEGYTAEAKARLIALLDEAGAEVAAGNGFKASYKEQKRAAHTVEASTFRVLRVSKVKGGKE
jgi:putative phage-type endonuclease